MSFEPKLYQSDEIARHDGSIERLEFSEPAMPLWDDAAQLELPDDLAALAEQLRDDAIYLAQSHPANATPEQRAAAWMEVQHSAVSQGNGPKSRLARIRWWASSVAAAAVVIGASWIGWSLSELQDQQRDGVAVVSTPSGEHRPAREMVARIPGADAPRSPAEMNVIAGSEEIPGPRVIRLPEDSPPRVISAGAFLQDVSGPELDAMLELLAEQTDTGLSI